MHAAGRRCPGRPAGEHRCEQGTSAPWVYVGDPSVPICTDGVCSIPGLLEYGGPTAVGSSVKQPPKAEEKAPPNTLNESRSAYSENTLVLQPIPSPVGITMTDGITMTNAVIECILGRSAAKYYDPAATLSDQMQTGRALP
jgi:hypothetical protein